MTYNAPLSGISVIVTKAIIPSNTPTQYELCIMNKTNHAQCKVEKSDLEFKTFRRNVRVALELGHLCDAECPWLYFRVQETKPSRSLFRSVKHPRRVQSNLTKYQSMLDMLITFLRTPKNQTCYRASTLITQEVVRFLFQGVDPDDVTLLKASPVAIHRLSPVQFKFAAINCSICTQCMDPENPESSALTTLPCGHTFHDDCILELLDKSLVCPHCEDLATLRSSVESSDAVDEDEII